MSKDEQTSPEVAKKAAKILRDPLASPESKSVAASALNQSPDKKKYIVMTRIYRPGPKGETEIGAGGVVPKDVDPEDIKALLQSGDIKEA